jgi:hypothetical protein
MMTSNTFHRTRYDDAHDWVVHHCHDLRYKKLLERGLEYARAVERAGICTDANCGDDLYDFLIDPAVYEARTRAFIASTL